VIDKLAAMPWWAWLRLALFGPSCVIGDVQWIIRWLS
jgi:hypothetical protein